MSADYRGSSTVAGVALNTEVAIISHGIQIGGVHCTEDLSFVLGGDNRLY